MLLLSTSDTLLQTRLVLYYLQPLCPPRSSTVALEITTPGPLRRRRILQVVSTSSSHYKRPNCRSVSTTLESF
ncbi:uncharacterized protein HMPREF1120_05763 [Exophiala dermatitidis NIH/UT8656]|uniref:Uncharacterized protein n=1 Tax=Exophiala dermatitidis (strain ATCC 34100 / CBS 525.76 / NIH/UT8656) TaxID=858893 RepID=H6C1F2_EXODN|nr:uncharacterized protein HMPREF1120_05763 [Exophiala dermatitidis NIH/UT8656]EHY57737.1 hypothetical protein HMPREF1120_05763 [Exophiala dermatitidis NIH/UT8656]